MGRRDEASTKKNPPPGFPGEGHHQNTLHLSLISKSLKLSRHHSELLTTNIASLGHYFQSFLLKKNCIFFIVI